jgi:hypothetical protein
MVSSVREVTDVPGWSTWGGGNDNMPQGFLQLAALRKEQCDMMPKIQNLGITEILEATIIR